MEHIHVIITWQGNHIIGEEMMLACKRKVEHGDHNGMGDVKKKPFLKAYMEEGKPKIASEWHHNKYLIILSHTL